MTKKNNDKNAAASFADSFLSTNSKVVKAFFSMQEKLVEKNKHLFSDDTGLDALIKISNNNQKVIEEFFKLQEQYSRLLEGNINLDIIQPNNFIAGKIDETSISDVSAQDVLSGPEKDKDNNYEEIMNSLREEISSLTGFPQDIIKNETLFSQELGLDSLSIMKVFMNVANKFPILDGKLDEFKGIESIGHFIDILASLSSGNNSFSNYSEEKTINSEKKNLNEEVVERFVLAEKKIEVPNEKLQRDLPQKIFIVGYESKFYNKLKEKIESNGIDVISFIIKDDKWECNGATVAFDDIKGLSEFINSNSNDSITPPVMFVSYEEGDLIKSKTSSLYRNTLSKCINGIFIFAKSLIHGSNEKDFNCQFFAAVGNDENSIIYNACRGFVNTLDMEWPNVKAIPVVIKEDLDQLNSDYLLQSIINTDIEREIILHKNKIHSRMLEKKPVDTNDKSSGIKLNKSSLVVLTGGGAGITAEMAVKIAELFKCKIVAIGRTPLKDIGPYDHDMSDSELKSKIINDMKSKGEKIRPDIINKKVVEIKKQQEILSTKKRVENAGGKFYYYDSDVSEEKKLKATIQSIKKNHKQINGLVHGAGFASDSVVSGKSMETFDNVFQVKANSSYYLYKILKKENLDFAILFSSIASYAGNYGQSDYSAGNAVIDIVSKRWNEEVDYPVKAILWSIWQDTGLASRNELLLQDMETWGVTGIKNTTGIKMFMNELLYGDKNDDVILVSPFSTIDYIHKLHHSFRENMETD